MRLRLTPRDGSLLDLLAALAATLPPAADLLGQVVGASPTSRGELAERLREAEHEADELTHQVLQRLAETFVTPFDREDIYRLASHLDDCMDGIEEVADRCVRYRAGELPVQLVTQAEVIQRCAELTAEAIPRLRTMRDLREYWVEVNNLENEGDALHRALLGSLFDGTSGAGSDPIEILRLKELSDGLERAIDAFEKVASTIESVAIKES